jgi:radical SAM superfamily enzyme YgiQ (UPF0313 family)
VANIPGIAYKKNGKVFRTSHRPGPMTFNTIPNFSLIKGYKKLSLFDIILQRRFPLLTVQASRGCPFSCKFCIVDTMFSGSYRTRDIENVIQDLKDKRKYGRKMMFVDNNFAANPSHTKKLLRRMIEENLGFDILVLTRIDIARDDELLTLMRQAGIDRLYKGFESIQPDTLEVYDKRQKAEEIAIAIEKLYRYGFRISGSFIFGADTDTVDTILSTVQFVLDHKLAFAYFYPIWGHYIEKKNNNSSLIPWYRSIFKGWEYIDGNFVTHFPLQMRPSELQMGLIKGHRKVFSRKAMLATLKQRNYKFVWDMAVHGWMWSRIEKSLLDYIPWLQELEHGLYDKNGKLIEERLKERVRRGSWPLFTGYLHPEQIRHVLNEPSSFFERSFSNDDDILCASSTRFGQSKK